MKRKLLAFASLVFALPAFAYSDFKDMAVTPPPANVYFKNLYVGLYPGYGTIDDMENNTGETAIARIAMGFDFYSWNLATFGFELGVQTGNSMLHDYVHDETLTLGGDLIPLTLKPVLDLLVGVKVPLAGSTPLYGMIKGGVAYRRLLVEHSNISSLNKLDPELQLGLGYNITPRLNVNVFYQGIFAGSAGLTADQLTNTGSFSHIPSQNSVFLGLEWNLA